MRSKDSMLGMAMETAIAKGPRNLGGNIVYGLNKNELHYLFEEEGFNLSNRRQNWVKHVQYWCEMGYAYKRETSIRGPRNIKKYTDIEFVYFPRPPYQAWFISGKTRMFANERAKIYEQKTGKEVFGWEMRDLR